MLAEGTGRPGVRVRLDFRELRGELSSDDFARWSRVRAEEADAPAQVALLRQDEGRAGAEGFVMATAAYNLPRAHVDVRQ